jgi:uncharacterized protein with PQ loop repeat
MNVLQKKLKLSGQRWIMYSLRITVQLRVAYKNEKPNMVANQFKMVIKGQFVIYSFFYKGAVSSIKKNHLSIAV